MNGYNNSMIMTCCGSFFKKVEMKANEVELSVTEYQLRELTGFVASEANHAESKKKESELDRIFAQLEGTLDSLD